MAGKSQGKAAGRKRNDPGKPEAAPVYPVEELAAYAHKLGKGYRPECVVTALRLKGLREATVAQAEKLVSELMKQEVS